MITLGLDSPFFSLGELEILKDPLDFDRFPEEIRRMILEWTLIQEESTMYGRCPYI